MNARQGRVALLNCGHVARPIGSSVGYGIDALNYTWCMPCTGANDVNSLRFTHVMPGYVRESGRMVVTYGGTKLGTITDMRFSVPRRRGDGSRWRIRVVYVTDVHGGKWIGKSADDQDLVHLRRLARTK